MKSKRNNVPVVRRPVSVSVADVCEVLEGIAPARLAQTWDNVGLLVGDPAAVVRRMLLCIDLTPHVLREAIRLRVDFVVAYHPPLFKPISRLRADSRETDAIAFRCARAGIAIYSPHTALDAAEGGTNDVIAAMADVRDAEPLEYVGEPADSRCKLVVFVPTAEADRVAEAMFAAGAGRIGAYEKCSHRVSGRGTFFGGASANPAVGLRGRLEFVDELRLELVVPSQRLPQVVEALRRTHSYEEPAFDIYALESEPTRGIGRVGPLTRATSLGGLAKRLQRATAASCVQMVGDRRQRIERAVIVVGAAGSLPFRTALGTREVVITGEIRHHDALALGRRGAAAIALGHWASERPVLPSLEAALHARLRTLKIIISKADTDPFCPL